MKQFELRITSYDAIKKSADAMSAHSNAADGMAQVPILSTDFWLMLGLRLHCDYESLLPGPGSLRPLNYRVHVQKLFDENLERQPTLNFFV